MLGWGFGFVEVGTLTPRAQAGNPRPRLFRLAQGPRGDQPHGLQQSRPAERLHAAASSAALHGVVGVNVGANKDSEDRIADYVGGVRAMAPVADYLTINISSPNTPGLRGLQDQGALEELLAGGALGRGGQRPAGLPESRAGPRATATTSASSAPRSTTASTR